MGCMSSSEDDGNAPSSSVSKQGKHYEVDTSGVGTGKAKLGDSNMANYGSKAHKDRNYKIAESEKEWNEAVKKMNDEGIHIWRVHNKRSESKSNDPDVPIFGIESVSSREYGNFLNGDCYIILHKYKRGGQGPSAEDMLYDAHFWLGGSSTQDEWGVAAYKTVELDDRFKGKVVQYREVEGNESKRFLQIFGSNGKYKFNVKEGGYKSGFREVKGDKIQKPKRLLQILGDKPGQITAIAVKCDKSSLNNTDSFILYTGTEGKDGGQLFQFNGTKSSGFEKNYAGQVISRIKTLAGLEDLKEVVINGKNDTSDGALEFFRYFFGPSCTDGSAIPDTKVSKEEVAKVLELYKVSNESGIMKCENIQTATEAGPSLDKGLLNSQDVFWVNCASIVYIWVGKESNRDERSQVYKFVEDEMKVLGYYNDVPQVLIKEGKETKDFWEAFDGKSTASKGGRWFSLF